MWINFVFGCMPAIRDCGFDLVDHPYYSSDLAPSNCYLFLNMKKFLSRKPRYQSDDKVTSAVEDYFEGQKETFLKTEI